jgi:AcrR family transcriptional regulator
MPKISAPTLAEHHALRRSALVAAAVAILAEDGVAALTPATVGRRASLARSSTYQYFDSGASLLATAVEAAQAEVDQVVSQATGGAAGPSETVDAYVTAVLGQATLLSARALRALDRAELPPMCEARLVELAAAQRAPLVAALGSLGVEDPEATARLVAALVDAASREIADGAREDVVRDRVMTIIRSGVVRA